MPQIDQNQAEDQGQNLHNFKVSQSQAIGLADFFHILHAGNADHDSTENHRCDDQLDEAIAERLHCSPGFRVNMSKYDAKHDGSQYLHIERFLQR